MLRPKARTDRTILSKPLMAINPGLRSPTTSYSKLDAALPWMFSLRIYGKLP
jgi:hypothetical protein